MSFKKNILTFVSLTYALFDFKTNISYYTQANIITSTHTCKWDNWKEEIQEGVEMGEAMPLVNTGYTNPCCHVS